jgi:hypothetical protein
VKRSTVVRLVIYLILPASACLALAYRVRIETWIWHLRHGQSDVFAKYVVPVPTNWYVEEGDGYMHTLTRLDTEDRTGDPKRDRKRRFHAIITLSTHVAFKPGQLDFMNSARSSMLKKQGIEPVVRTFDLDGETMSCVGGGKVAQMLKSPTFYESDPNAWDCWSSGWLEVSIMATDADMDDVWKIVSQIRKKS